jgi:hypothetical protein
MTSADLPSVPKTFSLDEANNMLPLVRRIVEDLVRDHERWQDKVSAFELATVGSKADHPDAVAELLQKDALRLAADIEGYVKELTQLGVECKGLDAGLVDFLAEMNGRAIYYCWKLGEPSVQYWHGVNAGFAGRHPLQPALAES